jgi:predicted ATPase
MKSVFLRGFELIRSAVNNPNNYPFSIPAIKSLDSVSFRTNVSFFVGENGSGKSTLLEAIAYQCGFNTVE